MTSDFRRQQLYCSSEQKVGNSPVDGEHWKVASHPLVRQSAEEELVLSCKKAAATYNLLHSLVRGFNGLRELLGEHKDTCVVLQGAPCLEVLCSSRPGMALICDARHKVHLPGRSPV